MGDAVSFIGFGEAAQAFAGGWATRPADLRAYDRKTDRPDAAAKWADYRAADVGGCARAAEAIAGAATILSLVTADQALAAARTVAQTIAPGVLYCDMNSVAPETKRAAARAIEAAGGRYVDVAVMAPVHPARAAVPLLVCGAHADDGRTTLTALGFTTVASVPGAVGAASAIKMIRSVMVKGIEALTAECFVAAHAAGVLDAVVASLDASTRPQPWAARADYNLDRMLVHGTRRAAEMEEVVATLDALGVPSDLARATAARQRRLGAMRDNSLAGSLADPLPATLEAKLDLILDQLAQPQADAA